MAFRFFRRIRIAPGLTINLSKSGASLSAGPRGAKVTLGSRGLRTTAGLPGTGLYYTKNRRLGGRGRGSGDGSSAADSPQVDAAHRLDLGFFKRLVTPDGEKAFVDGMRHILVAKHAQALSTLSQANHPDAHFAAGTLALRLEKLEDARRHLERALQGHRQLGDLYEKYGLAAAVQLPITEQLIAMVGVDRRGVLLTLAEVDQALGDWQSAIADLQSLHELDRRDHVVTLSLTEMLVEAGGSPDALKRAVALTTDIDNTSAIEAGLLLYRGKALRRMGLHTAARDALTAALRRTKDRPDDLLAEARYERALCYEALGQKSRARAEFEHVYAADPTHEAVARRLRL